MPSKKDRKSDQTEYWVQVQRFGLYRSRGVFFAPDPGRAYAKALARFQEVKGKFKHSRVRLLKVIRVFES